MHRSGGAWGLEPHGDSPSRPIILTRASFKEAGLCDASLIEAGILEAIVIEASHLEARLLKADFFEASVLAASLLQATLFEASLLEADLCLKGRLGGRCLCLKFYGAVLVGRLRRLRETPRRR